MNRTTIALSSAAAMVVLALAASRGGSPLSREGRVPAAFVERTTLEVALVEPGTLAAERSVTLATEIRSNRAKIVSLRPDGAFVKAGEVVVAFDRTPFEEERDRLAGELADAESAVVRAEQERKLSVAKAEESLQSEKARLEVAKLQVETYEKGQGALNVREAEVLAAEGSAGLVQARRDLADMEQMLARGFVSQGEITRQRDKVEEMERRSSLQGDRLKAARDVIYPRDLERARAEVRDLRDGVARAEAVLYHTHEFYRAAVDGAATRVTSARAAVKRAEEELEKTAIVAPLEGFLVHQEIPLEAGRRKPQVGDSVWSGQAIATVPDLSSMIVETRVREVDLHRIAEGMKASVAVEAYPDLVLSGRVAAVGNLAESGAGGPWKFFRVRLALDRTDPRLRPGMSARVSLLETRIENALVAPLDAIFPEGGRARAFVRRGGGVWEVPVELGKRNETHVQVLSGLEAGDELALSPPAEFVPAKRRPGSGDAGT